MQGCQMVHLHTKNPKFDIVCKALEWKIIVHLILILYVLWIFGTFLSTLGLFYGLLVCFMYRDLV
jgi:hypothetical protein